MTGRSSPVVQNVGALLLVAACTLPEPQFSGDYGSRLHADFLPAGSHRLVQVGRLANLAEIRARTYGTKPETTGYVALTAAGIPSDEISDGSLAAGIVFCCGGGISAETFVELYVPPGLPVKVGDVVEVRVGESPDLGPSARPNTALAVRAHGAAGGAAYGVPDGGPGTPCSWQPDQPGAWARVLYCTGIENEGWVRSDYLKQWMKPPHVN